MNTNLELMMQEALAKIDSMSIEELENDFKLFGIDVIRKPIQQNVNEDCYE